MQPDVQQNQPNQVNSQPIAPTPQPPLMQAPIAAEVVNGKIINPMYWLSVLVLFFGTSAVATIGGAVSYILIAFYIGLLVASYLFVNKLKKDNVESFSKGSKYSLVLLLSPSFLTPILTIILSSKLKNSLPQVEKSVSKISLKVLLLQLSSVLLGIVLAFVLSMMSGVQTRAWYVDQYPKLKESAQTMVSDTLTLESAKSYSNYGQVCKTIVTDLSNLQAFPVNPDKDIASNVKSALSEMSTAADKCVNASDANSNSQLSQSISDISDGLSKLKAEFVKMESKKTELKI